MKTGKTITRQEFLKGSGLVLLGTLLGRSVNASMKPSTDAPEVALTPMAYMPLVRGGTDSEPVCSRVIHIHDTEATDWGFSTGYYGNYVDQDVVNGMVDRGVMELAGASTISQAWRTLVPGYASGKAIAIKVNLNNAFECNDSDNSIDALIHPVNAIVRGLKQIGVAEQDIWVYEAVRKIPDRFVAGCLYPNVRFFGGCRESPGWSSQDPHALVTFHPPSGPAPSSIRIPDVLINAAYLINMPIMKTHDSAGVSLSFKNHFGTIRDPGLLHDYVFPGWSHFSTQYSPYIDIHENPHVGAKTVLTVGDGLFGAWAGYTTPPTRWKTFGNAAPNSLFFACDPVALDSVMYDFLAAETSIKSNADSYLSVAADAGLGTFEHGDPWGSGYSHIDYLRIET